LKQFRKTFSVDEDDVGEYVGEEVELELANQNPPQFINQGVFLIR